MSITRSMRQVAVLGLLTLILLPTSIAAGGSPTFPWYTPNAKASPLGHLPVRVLSPSRSTPVEALPPKQAYPYGWFGSNPTPHWQRSFGVTKGFTQWSRY